MPTGTFLVEPYSFPPSEHNLLKRLLGGGESAERFITSIEHAVALFIAKRKALLDSDRQNREVRTEIERIRKRSLGESAEDETVSRLVDSLSYETRRWLLQGALLCGDDGLPLDTAARVIAAADAILPELRLPRGRPFDEFDVTALVGDIAEGFATHYPQYRVSGSTGRPGSKGSKFLQVMRVVFSATPGLAESKAEHYVQHVAKRRRELAAARQSIRA